ncbi:LCCL domain-containing protein [Gaeumannomyces tritici R3-111a-1]|uniref:LCCL domain-containing protein n=1 Tax=Gaeumannomyces tritici (strain R3-111a-1) TaxID=644352 RepID=J3NN24_GAET3|nr:LCCL domain-containing protein [Gaeumannomyces tritici R3-111a-1]EJT77576.1 LCCL domain-containing protein [Gaeumannomyces tritici R3-111a-1]
MSSKDPTSTPNNPHATASKSSAVSLSTNDCGMAPTRRDMASGTEDELLDDRDSARRLPSPVPGPPSVRRGGGGGVDTGSGSKRWAWIPLPVRRCGNATANWMRGPPEPRIYKINPILPKVQRAPIRLLDKLVPHLWQRVCLAAVYIALWITAFALVLQDSRRATNVQGYGAPATIGCGTSWWPSDGSCGIDGVYCRPFNNTGFAFRCPANCASYRVLNPRAVGDQEVIYQSMVIGGPRDDGQVLYRGDSYICGAALHAGIISNTAGGCGVVTLAGEQTNYVSSTRNDITSIAFNASFPLSFTFQGNAQCETRDLRWPLLGLSVAFSAVFSLFVSSAPLFFFVVFSAIFWHVGMVSDPPNISSLAGLASNIIGKYLPAMLIAWVMYDKMGVRRTLQGLTAQVEKTVLWLGACWLGALENYTFSEWIPITRLTGRDISQQPGAKAALAIIIIVLVVVAALQVWFFRQEGRLLRYLKVYAAFVGAILVCLVMPDLRLRIHHYILALLLLPGTSMQTRPSLFYQGLLVGLFINGVARWGFDSVLQTAAQLQGDGQFFSSLPALTGPPNITLSDAAAVGNVSTLSVSWQLPGVDDDPDIDGVSVLVNDVERFRAFFADDPSDPNRPVGDGPRGFRWRRRAGAQINEYFRFGFVSGTTTLDYTKAGVWNSRGEWVDMAPGPSKVRRRSDVDDGVRAALLRR